MSPRVSRRDFLGHAGRLAAVPLVLGGTSHLGGAAERDLPRVAHVHHGRAARWSMTGGMYRDAVDQDTVSLMLDEAVRQIKGGNPSTAWQAVFPLDAPETRTLAIKINCNNALDPADGAGNEIDAIPEPVIAVIRGFVQSGGLSAHCNVYDATSSGAPRFIGEWFKSRVRAVYPDVKFNQNPSSFGAALAWDARTHVTWSSAYNSTPPETRISGLALDADYLVNVPIVKRHSQANVTLGYKNHFGSIDDCGQLHPWVYQDVPEASVLADIMGSPLVPGDPSVKTLAEKTALVVGDMLYGQPCSNFNVQPRPWQIFDNEWPNGLIVSDDPVAADSVMLDVLQSEPAYDGGCGGIAGWARRYLQYAELKGQGVHETVTLPVGLPFDPQRMTYTRIDYRWVDLWPSGADLTATHVGDGRVLLEWDHYFEGLYEVQRATRPDFSDAAVLGATPVPQWVDPSAPSPAFYRIRFLG